MNKITKKTLISLIITLIIIFNLLPFGVIKSYGLSDGYSADIEQTTLDLGSTKPGYDNSEFVSNFTITNTGTQFFYYQYTRLHLVGTDADKFEAGCNNNGVFSVGTTNNTAYYIRPISGLNTGVYTATVEYQLSEDGNENYETLNTCTVTFTVLEHSFSEEWTTTDSEYHWRNCLDSGCYERGFLGAHDRNEIRNAKIATFNEDGYTGDVYCSVCGREMSPGKIIAAGKYIRNSRITMAPGEFIAGLRPIDYTFDSTEPSKYTVSVTNWYDSTTSEEITDSTELIAGHDYLVTMNFEEVGNYVYDEMSDDYWSLFYLNDIEIDTTMLVSGSKYRKYQATCVEESSLPRYDITINPNGGKGQTCYLPGMVKGTGWIIESPYVYGIETPACHEFVGWKIGNKVYQPKDTYIVKTDITAIAQWKELTHTTNNVTTTKVNKATTSKDGSIIKTTETKCTKCGKVFNSKKETTVIPSIKTIALSKTGFTYNKKVQKPDVTVKDSKGKVLKNGTDYTITYSNKNSKKIGSYKVTISFKGNYEGTKTLTYNINPKGTSLSKLTAGKKQFKATWKKQTTETTGYEVQYATNKSFTSGKKTVKIKKNKTTTSTVKKLKAKKKYFVRIRTYKTVNGKKYYSGWSKIKNITTNK